MGAIEGGLGEVYARTLMVDEANAAFDAAAKADPANAALYLENQAIIFFQAKNASAQVDAADKAIKADPNNAFLYYIKAQGLAQNAPFDPRPTSPYCLRNASRRFASTSNWLRTAPLQPRSPRPSNGLKKSRKRANSSSPTN